MVTQINTLRNGARWQVRNEEIKYPTLSGTDTETCLEVWAKVSEEHPESMTIELFGQKIALTANWSKSGKSVCYTATVSPKIVHQCGMASKAGELGSITVQGNSIIVRNGGRAFTNVCPSLITIL